MKPLRYQISASKDGSIAKSIKSPEFAGDYAEAQAIRWASENCNGFKCVNLLCEHNPDHNAGKFFLHRFIKAH